MSDGSIGTAGGKQVRGKQTPDKLSGVIHSYRQ
jgi:hypothetical protein